MAARTTGGPILVVGATGRVGRRVVQQLLDRGEPVRALTRRPATARLPGDVEVVAGDLTVPESLDRPLRNARAVFLLWTAAPDTASHVIERVAAQTERVVLLTSPHRTAHPFVRQPNPMAAFHAELERLLAATRVASTIVRPGMFASNAVSWWASMIRDAGCVRWPYAAAATAPIDERDIAAVAVRALCDDGHAGKDYVLTGPESLSQAEQVATIGSVIGRHIAFEELSAVTFRHEMNQRAPGPWIDMLLAAWAATIGHPAFVTSTVEDVVGSPARTFRQWVSDHAEAFR